MTPSDFNWKADEQVTVTNPTNEDFRFQVHAKWYEVGAGKTAKMPGTIAWSYVYKLAVKMAIADKEFDHWNDENFRQQYYAKIAIGSGNAVQTVSNDLPEAEQFESGDDGEGSTNEDTEKIDQEDQTDIKPMKKRVKQVEKNA